MGKGYKHTNQPVAYADMSGYAADIKSTFPVAITEFKFNLMVLTEKLAAVEVTGKHRDRKLHRLESVGAADSSHFIEINNFGMSFWLFNPFRFS